MGHGALWVAMIEDLLRRVPGLSGTWEHLHRSALTDGAERLLASRSCGDLIVMLGPGSAGLLARIHGRAGSQGLVYVVDPSTEVLNWTAERVLDRDLVSIDVRRSPWTTLPVGAAQVDLVIAALSLHHESRIRMVLREVARVLVPSGRFLLFDAVTDQQRTLHCGGRALLEAELRGALGSARLNPVSWTPLKGAWVPSSEGKESAMDLTLIEALKER